MRVVSWNAQYGTTNASSALGSGQHSEAELRRALRAIAACQPDVVAFQEVERAQGRSNHLNMPRIITEEVARAGLEWTGFAPSFMGWARGLRFYPHPGFRSGLPAFGVMLAARRVPRTWKIARLGKAPVRWISRGSRWRGKVAFGENRVMLAAQLESGQVIGTTHLEIDPPTATAQAEEGFSRLLDIGTPALLVGDFNLAPARVAGALECRHVFNGERGRHFDQAVDGRTHMSAFTFPSTDPYANMDQAVLAPGAGGARVVSVRSLPLSVSDHAALVLDIQM